MKKIGLAFLTIFFVTAGYSQGVEKQMKTSANASQVYLEALGSGIAYSINYDGRFGRMENGVGIRVGAGGAGGDGGGYFALPVQINYLLGSNGQYMELGAGATYLTAGIDLFDNSGSSSTVAATATLGFRKQPFGRKGITWRIAFTPFLAEGTFVPWGGVSIGYRF